MSDPSSGTPSDFEVIMDLRVSEPLEQAALEDFMFHLLGVVEPRAGELGIEGPVVSANFRTHTVELAFSVPPEGAAEIHGRIQGVVDAISEQLEIPVVPAQTTATERELVAAG